MYIINIVYILYIYIYLYIDKDIDIFKIITKKTTICDNQFGISAFQITPNNKTNYFYRNILLSFPTTNQTQLKISSENV